MNNSGLGENRNVMLKISEFIVDKHRAFYLIFAAAFLLCLFTMSKVRVNNDISSYLPDDTETRRGLTLMDEEFITYDTEKVMVTNVSYSTAEKLVKRVEKVDGVKSVDFEDDAEHYKESSALFTVTLDVDDDLDAELAIIDDVKETLSGYDYYMYSDSIDSTSKHLDDEVKVILLVSILIIIAVLIFTSMSFMEIPVFLTVFGVAAVLNMGTNYIFGEISFITKSVAVILQLALAIDYSIILSHRFAEEKQTKNTHDAIVSALSKAIIEISSSSLTTIAGLAALCIMQLKIGMDMGLVLCKGILCSLISVFLLMPGLLLRFSRLIDKTVHKSYVPNIEFIGRAMIKLRYVMPFVFMVVIVVCAFMSAKCDYTFDSRSEQAKKVTEESISRKKISEVFKTDHQLAVIIPSGDYDKETKVISLIEREPEINSALGLANTRINDDYLLTQKINARELSKLLGIEYDKCCLLFQAYGVEHDEYSAIFADVNDYTVPIIDLFMYIHEKMDLGIVNLDAGQTDDLNELYDKLVDAKDQLESDRFSRLVFTYKCDVESEESYALLKNIRAAVEQYYPDCLMVSDSVNSRDLGDSFGGDNKKISVVTILAVLLILMVTFRSAGIPVLLVIAIQGSIWINFAIPYITRTPLFFLSYLVISAIQMGATIDYAIVFTNRYLQLKEKMSNTEAAVSSFNQSFPTILTSGSILMLSGFVIGKLSSDAIISSLGIALGRGTLISIIVVMFVLPQIIVLCDKVIEKTSFKREDIKDDEKARRDLSGLIVVNGRIRGDISGFVDGVFFGVVKGQLNARVELGEKEDNLIENTGEEFVDIDKSE